MKRSTVIHLALFMVFAFLALPSPAFAQAIQIDVSGADPEFLNRGCPYGDKGDVCPGRGTKAPINFTIVQGGSQWSIERVDLFAEGPNADANPACYTRQVAGCGGMVPETYCEADGSGPHPWNIDTDFPGFTDIGSMCQMRCSGNTCRVDNQNNANWKWRYEVWVTDGGTPKRVDPIITNRGTGGN